MTAFRQLLTLSLGAFLLAACNGGPTSPLPPLPTTPTSAPLTPELPPNVAGGYELHVIASAACSGTIPGAMRDRRYPIELTQSGVALEGRGTIGIAETYMAGEAGPSS